MSKWCDREARTYIERYTSHGQDIALRIYTTRLLGADPSLVLHGGGNTSVKTRVRDETGREVDVLSVKGSGWDMGTIEPEGLPLVALEPLQELRRLESLSDEAMVNGVRRQLLDTRSPNPSVETLLHAFIPEKFIDHTHADAVLALVNQEHAEDYCREVFGASMGLVPYIMPGFQLAKKAAEIYDADASVEGLILINHGIFTFGKTAREAYERMIDKIGLAQSFIEEQKKTSYRGFCPSLKNHPNLPRCMAILRGALSQHPQGFGSLLLHTRSGESIDRFLSREDLASISGRGPATPDHIIRTKQKPMLIENPDLENPDRFRDQVNGALSAYVAAYHAYFKKQVGTKDKKELHPLPLVILIPGIGFVCAGKTAKETQIVGDIYEHTIHIITGAEDIHAYRPLPQEDLFEMEYWSLEQAKLGKKAYRPLEGHITLVTGAAGTIGQAVARRFARAGSHLLLTDREQAPLTTLCEELRRLHKVEVISHACDLTRPESGAHLVRMTCLELGGLDLLISNAGIAPEGPIEEACEQLKLSLSVNLLAHQYLAAAATEIMKAQDLGGCLLFNASKSAFNPGSGFGAYAVAKAGLVALMKQYALEMAPKGIRSLAINADRIRSQLLNPAMVAKRCRARGLEPDQYFAANLLGREVLAEDVAEAFLMLYRSPKSTGLVFTVDGGNIAAAPR